jgi:hypothetical protein
VQLHREPEPQPPPVQAPLVVHAVDVMPQEDPQEQPEPQPGPAADLITGAQMRKLRASLRDYQQLTGLKLDRDQTRDLIAGIAGRNLTTANDLTKAEASTVIDRLAELITEEQSTDDVVDAELIEDEQ